MRVTLAVWVVAATAACPRPGGPASCVPGASESCACPGGAVGTQVCQPDGTFAVCSCPTRESSGTSGTSSSSSGSTASGSSTGSTGSSGTTAASSTSGGSSGSSGSTSSSTTGGGSTGGSGASGSSSSGQASCLGVVCEGSGTSDDGGPSCVGTCVAGACVYGGACSDKAQCLSNGSCNPTTGACQGTSDCEVAGASTCNGDLLTGEIPPGACDQGTGTCLYNTETVTCDCACVQTGSTASCTYQWEPVQGLPSGSAASVWSAGQTAGDLWLAVINGTNTELNPNAVYHEVNGAWTQVGTVANAYSAICAGPGCGLALVGSTDSDVYGVTDCTAVSGGQCTAGGAWHYTGTAADENFPSLGSSGPDLPLTTILDIAGTGYALNSAPSGPEIVSGTAGTWTILFDTKWGCESQGGIWGTSSSDLWLGWGCNGVGAGQLAHFNGAGLDSSKTFPLPAGEYVEGLWGTSDSDIWAAGTHRWHYNGTSWTEDAVAPPGGNGDQAVWGNGTDYFAGGGYVGLFHLAQTGGTITTDWTEECVAPGYADPSVYSFASDGTNFYATTSSTTAPGLVQRCPNGICP